MTSKCASSLSKVWFPLQRIYNFLIELKLMDKD